MVVNNDGKDDVSVGLYEISVVATDKNQSYR
jgi:hypothetical protein